jgi:hypothetical protein
VEDCKKSIRQQKQLSADTKKDLVEICEQAVGGDPKRLQRAARRACLKVVEELVPPGKQHDQAKKACLQTPTTTPR